MPQRIEAEARGSLRDGDSSGDGEYALFIDVTDENIEAHENANPVKTLRMRYDALAP